MLVSHSWEIYLPMLPWLYWLLPGILAFFFQAPPFVGLFPHVLAVLSTAYPSRSIPNNFKRNTKK